MRRTFRAWALPSNLILLAPALAVFACSARSRPKSVEPEAQTYAQAIGMMCNVDSLAAISSTSSELELAEARSTYIVENTTNGDAIYFATVWRTKTPTDQATLLAEQAQKAGIRRCALADSLRALPSD